MASSGLMQSSIAKISIPSAALGSVRPVFRAVAVTLVPEAARLDTTAWARMEEIVEAAIADRPPALARQLRLFLRLLKWLPILRFGRRFPALDPLLRARVLSWVQDSQLRLLRHGFWGLKTLVLMGYYGRDEARSEIGYRGDQRGWAARR